MRILLINIRIVKHKILPYHYNITILNKLEVLMI